MCDLRNILFLASAALSLLSPSQEVHSGVFLLLCFGHKPLVEARVFPYIISKNETKTPQKTYLASLMEGLGLTSC